MMNAGRHRLNDAGGPRGATGWIRPDRVAACVALALATGAGSAACVAAPRAAKPKVASASAIGVVAPPEAAAPEGGATSGDGGAEPTDDATRLRLRLAARGVEARLDVDGRGRVETIQHQRVARRAFTDAEALDASIRRWLSEEGPLLGYGELGSATIPAVAVTAGTVAVRTSFPDAKGCPGLVGVLTFAFVGDAGTLIGMPGRYSFICPTDLASARRSSIASRMLLDGLPEPVVERDGGSIVVKLATPYSGRRRYEDPGSSRIEVVKGWAARYKDLLGFPMPELDAVSTTEEATQPGERNEHIVRAITLRPKKPLRTSECIAPAIGFELGRDHDCTPLKSCRWFIEAVSASCAREPARDREPAPDAARVLPRAASGSTEFLATCESTSYAWGYSRSGVIIDRKGDVWGFEGGPPLLDGTANTPDDLFQRVRYGRSFIRTIPPTEVDRHVALVPRALSEPLVKKQAYAPDLPSTTCSVFVNEPSGKLRAVPLSTTDAGGTSKRIGPASTKLLTWLDGPR